MLLAQQLPKVLPLRLIDLPWDMSLTLNQSLGPKGWSYLIGQGPMPTPRPGNSSPPKEEEWGGMELKRETSVLQPLHPT